MGRYFQSIRSNFKWKHYANYLVLAIFFTVFVIMQNTGMMRRSTANLLTQIAFSIILAVSLNLVVGFLGELSLGHAGFMCVGAYIGIYCSNLLFEVIGSKLVVVVLCMIIGGVVAGILGFLVGLPALRLKGDYLAIVTLAFGEIVRNIFKNLSAFGGALGLRNPHTYGSDLFILAFVMVFLMLIVVQNLVRSKHGRAITAIRDNEIAAHAMGINVTYYKLFVFVISAVFAGIAGVIYGYYATPILYSYFDYNYSIEILVMVVLGGMGSINGSILAAALITYINFILQTNLSGDLAALKNLIYALILMVVVIFGSAPGLVSFKEKYNLKRMLKDLFRRKWSKEKLVADSSADDESVWTRIPTKIHMDELLSTDLSVRGNDQADEDDGKGGVK